MRAALGAAVVLMAVGCAVMLTRAGGGSRESLVPLSRAVAEHGKAADRALAVPFPLSAEEERRHGERLASGLAAAEPAPGTPEAGRAALWRELGAEAAASAGIGRFRGRYEFRVAASGGGANAFALPGGFVYATPELLARLADDPDALLFVAGHEIGHVELLHCADGFRLRAGQPDPLRAVVGGVLSVSRVLAALHFSEVQELEADAFAGRLLHALRRDPLAGLRAMDALGLPADRETKRRVDEVLAEGLSDYFRTHPGSWERRAALERSALSSRGAEANARARSALTRSAP